MSSKVFSQEFTVTLAEVGNSVEDIPPQIKIIPLVDDAVILTDREFAAAKHRGAGILIEAHHHGPLQKCLIAFHDNRVDLHGQLLTAFGQPVAHRLKIIDSLDPLNAVLKYDLVMITGEDVRPVRFSLAVIRL